jgi:hypothetical protein
MKWKTFFIVLLCLPVFAWAQTQTGDKPSPLEPFSPFEHLTPGLQKTNIVKRSICPLFMYYQNSPTANSVYYVDSLPVSTEWVMRIPIPPERQATVCTVWTQYMDFELLNASLTSRDTIRYYVRNASPPYTILYSTWFLARVGLNQGTVEVDPVTVHPFVTPIISPARDILVGYKVIGDSSHQVKWRFTTPALFTNPPRTFKMGPSGLIPVSNVVGQSVDWVHQARLCCTKWIPVELSVFNATLQDDGVLLRWRTEKETNNYHFQIERSHTADGPWESRGYIPGHGTTTEPRDYSHLDRIASDGAIPPVLWYRLRQHDFDGAITEYPPIQVHTRDLAMLGFELGPVYPNPLLAGASQFAQIRYRVPEDRHVRVSVFDMLGRELTVLADNAHPAGVYETAWAPLSGNGPLTNGTYIVRLVSDDVVLSKNITIVR